MIWQVTGPHRAALLPLRRRYVRSVALWCPRAYHCCCLPPSHPLPRQRMILYDYDWASANDEIGRGEWQGDGPQQCPFRCYGASVAGCLGLLPPLRVLNHVPCWASSLACLPRYARFPALPPTSTPPCSVCAHPGPAAWPNPGPVAGCGLRECAQGLLALQPALSLVCLPGGLLPDFT